MRFATAAALGHPDDHDLHRDHAKRTAEGCEPVRRRGIKLRGFNPGTVGLKFPLEEPVCLEEPVRSLKYQCSDFDRGQVWGGWEIGWDRTR